MTLIPVCRQSIFPYFHPRCRNLQPNAVANNRKQAIRPFELLTPNVAISNCLYHVLCAIIIACSRSNGVRFASQFIWPRAHLTSGPWRARANVRELPRRHLVPMRNPIGATISAASFPDVALVSH
jgi:hypothetical protein